MPGIALDILQVLSPFIVPTCLRGVNCYPRLTDEETEP